MENRVQSAYNIALMATDTLEGLKRIDAIWHSYVVGLITADEAIERL